MAQYQIHVKPILVRKKLQVLPDGAVQGLRDAVSSMLTDGNRIYQPAGVQFVFDPADFEIRTDPEKVEDLAVGAANPNKNADAREDLALQFPGKLVVVYRDYQDSPAYIALGFSGGENDYAVLQLDGSLGGQRAFAHEIGHYLGLPHTFGPLPESIAEATAVISDWIARHWGTASDTDVLNRAFDGFDGDLYIVADTAPDFGPGIYTGLSLDPCDPDNSKMELTIPANQPTGETINYYLKPTRDNIMSYFKDYRTRI